MAAAAGGSALYVRAVTNDDAARLLRARASEFASIVQTDTRAMQAAVTIARIADASHESGWMTRDAGPVIGGVPGIGMWIAEPDGRVGRAVAAVGDPSVLRSTMTRAEWHAVFAVRGTTVRPTLARRRPDGSLILGVVASLTGGRAIVLELDVRRLIATTIGPRSGVQGALYFGTQAFPTFLIAATRADGTVPGPRASRVLDLGGVPSLLVVGDPTSLGPGWLPPAIFVGGPLVALVAASLVEALRRRRDAALETVALLEDRNRELDDLGVKLRSAAAELAHRADHDELTGLANRALLHRRVHEAAAAGEAGIVLFDLDDFKAINDTLGHDAGDAALCIVAERLRTVAGEHALAVRLGGDEFALCTASADPAELRSLSELVLDRVGGTAGIAGQSLELGLSIGTAAWPGTTELPGDLLRDADLAMYAPKRARRAEYRRRSCTTSRRSASPWRRGWPRWPSSARRSPRTSSLSTTSPSSTSRPGRRSPWRRSSAGSTRRGACSRRRHSCPSPRRAA